MFNISLEKLKKHYNNFLELEKDVLIEEKNNKILDRIQTLAYYNQNKTKNIHDSQIMKRNKKYKSEERFDTVINKAIEFEVSKKLKFDPEIIKTFLEYEKSI